MHFQLRLVRPDNCHSDRYLRIALSAFTTIDVGSIIIIIHYYFSDIDVGLS